MEENLNKVFSRNLLHWLSLRGKTQADMRKYMDVSSAIASDWCNAKKIPRTDKLVKLCDWLMIDLSNLLEENENEPNNLDRIAFRLKDDDDFYNLVSSINEMNAATYIKLKDYVTLLQK